MKQDERAVNVPEMLYEKEWCATLGRTAVGVESVLEGLKDKVG
jgi:hypothetical protein